MPLQLTNPIPGPATASLQIIKLFVDFVGGSASVMVQAFDADGNPIGQPTYQQIPAALLQARMNELYADVYADLQTALGVTGTVT